MTLSPVYLAVGFVAGLRLGELIIARRNTKALLARGAREIGAGHYPLFILLHASWLAAILFSVPPDRSPDMALIAAFLLLQLGRLWVLASLGPYWTTRIITLDEAPLVRRGPFRFVRHPNYMVVVAEIAVLPLAFGAVWVAAIWSVLNGLLLAWRIRIEDAALKERR